MPCAPMLHRAVAMSQRARHHRFPVGAHTDGAPNGAPFPHVDPDIRSTATSNDGMDGHWGDSRRVIAASVQRGRLPTMTEDPHSLATGPLAKMSKASSSGA